MRRCSGSRWPTCTATSSTTGAALTRGAGELDGFVAFDAERVRIELVNSADRAADHPIVRFPNWGDAADLIDMIDVRSLGDGRYVSVPRADWRRPVVEGSQMLGQMVVAAMRETGGRRAVSASIVLIRAADARAPLTFVLDVLSHGRTFSTVSARVEQNDRVCAAGTLLLDSVAPEVIHHDGRRAGRSAPGRHTVPRHGCHGP